MVLAFFTLAAGAAVLQSADACDRRPGNDIVICGSRTGPSPYRLPKLPDKYEAKRIRAETNIIPGVKTSAHVDTVAATPDGYRSNRVMVTFKVPF
jgi:hypothetical protein